MDSENNLISQTVLSQIVINLLLGHRLMPVVLQLNGFTLFK